MFGTILAEAATQLPDFGSQLGYVTLMVAAALLGASTAKLKRITIPSVLGQLLIGIAIKAIAEIAGLSFADAAVHSVLVYFLAVLVALCGPSSDPTWSRRLPHGHIYEVDPVGGRAQLLSVEEILT